MDDERRHDPTDDRKAERYLPKMPRCQSFAQLKATRLSTFGGTKFTLAYRCLRRCTLEEQERYGQKRNECDDRHAHVPGLPPVIIDQGANDWRTYDTGDAGTRERDRKSEPSLFVKPCGDGPCPHQRRCCATRDGEQEKREV